MNWALKIRISERFGSQVNFVAAAKEAGFTLDEFIVSRVVRGRRRLPVAERARWAALLGAPVESLFPEPAPAAREGGADSLGAVAS